MNDKVQQPCEETKEPKNIQSNSRKAVLDYSSFESEEISDSEELEIKNGGIINENEDDN